MSQNSTLNSLAQSVTAKRRALPIAALALTAASLTAVMSLSHPSAVAAQAAPSSPEFYTQKVQPILSSNCYRCHGGDNPRGGLSMQTQSSFMRGGKDGAVIVPGHPEQSLLIALIRHEGPADDPMPMPPKGKLSDDDIAVVTAWIKAGAAMPPDSPK